MGELRDGERSLGEARFATNSFVVSKPDDLADGKEIQEGLIAMLSSGFLLAELARLSGKIAGKRLNVFIEFTVSEP